MDILYYLCIDLSSKSYYYPNYALLGSPWYGHPYPIGYSVVGGQFMPVSSGPSALLIIGIVLGIIALGVIAWLVLRKRGSKTPTSFASHY